MKKKNWIQTSKSKKYHNKIKVKRTPEGELKMETMKLKAILGESKYDYETYHNSFGEAADEARRLAERRGYEIDEDDWFIQVATGGRYTRARPGVGKTHSFQVEILKNGKPQRKMLNFSVYGMTNQYELTAYIN